MTEDEKQDRIEQLEWNLAHCKGWFYFKQTKEWQAELDKLRNEVD